jgi:hypothetical protein
LPFDLAQGGELVEPFRISCFEFSSAKITINELKHTRSYLKNADYVQEQGAGRRKSGAYTVVCKHFEEVSNAVIGR